MEQQTDNDRRWRYWIILAAVVVIFVAGRSAWNIIADWRDVKTASPPAAETAATDSAAERAERGVADYQNRQEQLPEVIYRETNEAARRVDALDDGGIADAWNERLMRYRENNAASAGIQPDE